MTPVYRDPPVPYYIPCLQDSLGFGVMSQYGPFGDTSERSNFGTAFKSPFRVNLQYFRAHHLAHRNGIQSGSADGGTLDREDTNVLLFNNCM